MGDTSDILGGIDVCVCVDICVCIFGISLGYSYFSDICVCSFILACV